MFYHAISSAEFISYYGLDGILTFLKGTLLILKISKEKENEFIVAIPLFSCIFDLLFIGYS